MASPSVTLRIPQALLDRIDANAKTLKVSRSEWLLAVATGALDASAPAKTTGTPLQSGKRHATNCTCFSCKPSKAPK